MSSTNRAAMKCGGCGKVIKFPAEKIGKTAKCPGCQTPIRLVDQTKPRSIEAAVTATNATTPPPGPKNPIDVPATQQIAKPSGEWMIRRNDGQEFGPYSQHDLENFASQGKMPVDTLARCSEEFDGQWVAVSRIASVGDLMGQAAKIQASQASANNADPNQQILMNFRQKRITAFLLSWFLLGPMGTHKFYLGQTNAGIIMAVLSSIAIAGSCFFFPLILLVVTTSIAWIEGVIYLLKTDEEFAQIYGIEKRQWF